MSAGPSCAACRQPAQIGYCYGFQIIVVRLDICTQGLFKTRVEFLDHFPEPRSLAHIGENCVLVLIILFPSIGINENNFRNVSGSTRPRTNVELAKVPGTQNLAH